MDPIEFIGLTKLLSVELMEDEQPRSFTDVLSDALDRFSKCNRARQREILHILRGVGHAGNTKDKQ